MHVLAKNGMFLFRFNNGEFGSKWCGIWKKATKYIDYFAFTLNGVSLSSGNAEKFEFYNSQFSRLVFHTKDGTVTEDVTCIDDAVIITIKPEFKASLSAEFGVNIRDRSENYSKGKHYEVDWTDKRASISNTKGAVRIFFGKGNFKKNEYYGIHTPGLYAKENGFSKYFDDCSTQNKYVPGSIEADIAAGEEVNFIISTRDIDNETVFKMLKNRMGYPKEYDILLKKTYSNFSENNVMNEGLLKDSVDALYSYANLIEKEFYAGYPYFNTFWARDALIVLPSFLSINNPGFVRGVLQKIAGMVSESGIPAFPGSDTFPLDVPPNFIICLCEYLGWTGDLEMVRSVSDKVDLLINFGLRFFERGLIHDTGRMSWMDSLDREYSIEIQALWIKALECYARVGPMMGKEVSHLKSSASQIRANLEKYRRDGYFSDQAGKSINSANQLFLTFHKLLSEHDSKLILENAKENLLGGFGVYSVSIKDPTFNPGGYQNGSVWPLLTNILAASAFHNNDYELGKKCIDVLSTNLGAQCSSRINEIFQPDGTPRGCSSQAWSIGMLPYILDRCLLGMEINAPAGEIRITPPHRDIAAKRALFIGGKEIKLEFVDGEVNSNKKVVNEQDYIRVIL